MALSRAIETRRPPAERICSDPYAERFLGLGYRFLLSGRPVRDAVERLIELSFPGHHHYVLARTRYIDDFLLEELVDGPEQLVILGAGFDSRAHRFADRLRGVAVFEVDHPATSATKRARMRKLFHGAEPAHVTYVPVDFNVERLGDRLRAGGYRDDSKTVFLWEGVTPYLAQDAVDGTLDFIRSSSAPGSVVIFDYILKSVVDGTCALRGARNEHRKMERTSEPLVFGIVEDRAASYLRARRFREVVDVGAAELKERYFGGERQDRYVKPWWRIAHATVS